MFRCCCWFTAHTGTNKHSMFPIKSLINQWNTWKENNIYLVTNKWNWEISNWQMYCLMMTTWCLTWCNIIHRLTHSSHSIVSLTRLIIIVVIQHYSSSITVTWCNVIHHLLQWHDATLFIICYCDDATLFIISQYCCNTTLFIIYYSSKMQPYSSSNGDMMQVIHHITVTRCMQHYSSSHSDIMQHVSSPHWWLKHYATLFYHLAETWRNIIHHLT